MLCVQGFTKTKKRRSTGYQPGTKSSRGSADKPLVNRPPCSSIRFMQDFVNECFRKKKTRMVVFGVLEGKTDGSLLGAPDRHCPRPAQPRPAAPRRPAVRRPVPTLPWYVRVLDSSNVWNHSGHNAEAARGNRLANVTRCWTFLYQVKLAKSCGNDHIHACVNLSNPKPEHTTGGAGRGEAAHGRPCAPCGYVGTGRRRVGSPRKQPTLLPPWGRRQMS